MNCDTTKIGKLKMNAEEEYWGELTRCDTNCKNENSKCEKIKLVKSKYSFGRAESILD